MPNIDERLAGLPFRNAKASLRRGETPVQKLNPSAGDVLDLARGNVRLEPKQMADTMGISHSLVLRGLKSADDLGWHRLWELSDDFWIELIVAVVRQRLAKRMDVGVTLNIRRAG